MAEFQETYTVDCPDCESDRIVKIGIRNGYQRYRCNDCRKKFNIEDKPYAHQTPVKVIASAVDMYYSGMSYKQIAEHIAMLHNVPEPSKETIYRWVKNHAEFAAEQMEHYPAKTSGHWVADEMMLDVGGEKLWNWNVMDSGTRYILASYLSKNRDARAAEAVFRKAIAASQEPPRTIKTDKLKSYISAARKVFPSAQHIQSDGIRSKDNNNNRSERLQGTFRDRAKTLRGLETRETGQRYLDGWVVDYNLFRGHEALDGKTPGEAAGVNPPFREWEDVVRGRVRPKGQTTSIMRPRMLVVTNMSQPRTTPNSGRPTGEYRRAPKSFRPRAKATSTNRGRGGHDRRLVGPQRKK